MLAALAGMALLAGTEAVVRATSPDDLILWEADPDIGYQPRPNQRGAGWEFNSHSMAAPAFEPSDRVDILLLGDSLVFDTGPEPIAQQISQLTGAAVWPAAAGSWALLNELAWVEANRPVAEYVDAAIFVLNAEDFGERSVWRSPAEHPIRPPASFALHQIHSRARRTSLWHAVAEPDRTPDSMLWSAPLSHFCSRSPRTIFFLYPRRHEEAWPEFVATRSLELLAACPGAVVIDVSPEWSDAYYADHIHPTQEGQVALAQFISSAAKPILPPPNPAPMQGEPTP